MNLPENASELREMLHKVAPIKSNSRYNLNNPNKSRSTDMEIFYTVWALLLYCRTNETGYSEFTPGSYDTDIEMANFVLQASWPEGVDPKFQGRRLSVIRNRLSHIRLHIFGPSKMRVERANVREYKSPEELDLVGGLEDRVCGIEKSLEGQGVALDKILGLMTDKMNKDPDLKNKFLSG